MNWLNRWELYVFGSAFFAGLTAILGQTGRGRYQFQPGDIYPHSGHHRRYRRHSVHSRRMAQAGEYPGQHLAVLDAFLHCHRIVVALLLPGIATGTCN